MSFSLNTRRIAFLPLAFCASSFAAEGGLDDPDLFTLIQLMETDVATKTALQDPDKAPGLVSVLNGAEMRSRGYGLVADVLQHQAGFDIAIDSRGLLVPSVRGIGGIRSGASGKVKVMINGVAVNFVRAAVASRVLNLPMNVIEKIEMIRGPGSAVHGEYAYAAVVNIVTRKGDTELGSRVGSDGLHMTHALYNYSNTRGLNIDVTAEWNESDDEVKTGPDALYFAGQPAVSNAPGYSNEYNRQKFLSVAASFENSEITAFWNEQAQSDFFGLSSALATNDNDQLRNINRYWTVEGRHVFGFEQDVSLAINANIQHYSGDFKNIQVQPAGYSVALPPIPELQFPGLTVVYPDGILSETTYDEERIGLAANLTYRGIDNHVLLVGAEYKNIENTLSEGAINLDITNPNPLFAIFPTPEIRQFPGSVASIDEGKVREITSVVVQDEYRLTDALAITTGLRFDSYSDVADATTPRVAMVYTFNDTNTLKFQYAEAFRPPTYAELFSRPTVAMGNPNIEPETIDTTELAWIYKTRAVVVRATAFYSDMDNLIVLSPTGPGTQQFTNSAGATTQGIEFETEISFSDTWRLDTNISFTDSEDKLTDKPLEGVADLLANVNVVYQPSVDWSFNTHVNYVGSRHRADFDPRPDVDDYTTVDVVVNAFNLVVPGLTLRAGVDNAFDEDVVKPAPFGTYAEDFPRAGRAFFVELTKSFQ